MRFSNRIKAIVSVITVTSIIFVFSSSAMAITSTLSPISSPRYGLGSATVNGKIYAIGGQEVPGSVNTVEEYDPTTDTWTTKSPMGTARECLGVVALNDKIYAIGGMYMDLFGNNYYTNVVEEYDPATDTWTTKNPMNTDRANFAIAVANGKIYVIGGGTNSVEEYNPTTNTWTQKTPLANSVGNAAATINGIIYTMGNTVDAYDPSTDTWSTKVSLTTSRCNAGVAAVNGKIYAIGGYHLDGFNSEELSSIEEYDPSNNTITTKVESMPTARDCFGTAVLNDKIYAIGGASVGQTDVVEVYDPSQEFILD